MKKSIIFCLLKFTLPVILSAQIAVPIDTLIRIQVLKDTLKENYEKEDAQIEDILRSRIIPQKDKVQYFSQVIKYGFRNLFAQYSYNTSLPYSAQINPNASSFIQDYMKVHGHYLTQMKGWGQPYFNLIESILIQYGLPRELKYIAVIESNLSNRATSNKGAGGPWQFMPYTARDYGLSVNGFIDERKDYYKSTHAAARYLLSLYRKLHDWLLVMAAYNGGPGRVYNAIQKSGSRNFWNLQYYLPAESRTYVKRFIATHYIMEGNGGVTTQSNYAGSYNPSASSADPYSVKPQLNPEEVGHIEVMAISGKFNSVVIAKNLSMPITDFNRMNPNFDYMIANNGNYDLRLPEDKMQLFGAYKYQILNECIQVLLADGDVPNYLPSPGKKIKKKKIV